ncbi:MAG: hypothetical protein AAGA85_04530 [Bacteroidota bacterium]
MQSYIRTLTLLVAISGLFLSCEDELDLENDSFFRIYSNRNAEIDYEPIDIVETASGYVILAATKLVDSDFKGIQIITVDKAGNFLRERTMDSEMVVPTPDMFRVDSTFYFFAMSRTTLRAQLIATDENFRNLEVTPVGNVLYPLSAAMNSGGNLLLQSYDPASLTTVISEVRTDGTVLNQAGYTIGAGQDVEPTILAHYLEPDGRQPFFCGEVNPGNYYFNGFYDFSLSLVFSDFSQEPSGVVQGQSDNGGIRAAYSITGNLFALVGFQFDENYVVPSTPVGTGTTSSSIDLFSSDQAELKTGTPAAIIPYGENHVVIAAETESREVALYFYNLTTTEVSGIETIGFINPFTLSTVRTDEEQNLLVIGTTFTSGRFERVFFRKVAASDVNGFLN